MTIADLSRWATWRELTAQPAIWRGWAAAFDPVPVRDWIAATGASEVWFCGAGTSAYIGDILAAGLEGQGAFRSVPTTDLVSRPAAYLSDRRPLVVNFGRSGNSTETVGVLDALDALAPRAPRLNITCNADSALANRTGENGRAILLPEATHDAGFAMTSSFSTMLMTALAVFDGQGAPGRMAAQADRLDRLLPDYVAAAGEPPKRIVFLGTGPLAYAAREAALKVLELTAGQVPALWDTTLGFRHGPKSFVTPGTMIVVFTSPDDPAARYEADLLAELKQQFPLARVVAAGPGGGPAIDMADGALWGAALAVALGQVLAVIWSDAMGLNVDDPFAGQGTLTRVVSGVTLYPVTP